jgi:protein phosphatase
VDISFAGATDIGRRRQDNQDAIGLPERAGGDGPWLFVLADGMGGQQGGQVASELAVKTVRKTFHAARRHYEPEDALTDALLWANLAVFEKAQAEPELAGMGTTLLAAALLGGEALLANVGDSRCYLYRNGRLLKISQDHSLVAEQVRQGKLSEEQARSHPLRNVLTRAVGTQPELAVDIISLKVMTGDFLLMCSDGLHGPMPEAEIGALLDKTTDLTEACQALLAAANEHGGPDNISVVLIRVDKAPPVKDREAKPRLRTRQVGPPAKPPRSMLGWILAGAMAAAFLALASYFVGQMLRP